MVQNIVSPFSPVGCRHKMPLRLLHSKLRAMSFLSKRDTEARAIEVPCAMQVFTLIDYGVPEDQVRSMFIMSCQMRYFYAPK